MSSSDGRGIWVGQKRFSGKLNLFVLETEILVVNVLGIEKYLSSVVGSEMPAKWPIEALKAQAVIARTWGIFNSDRFNMDKYHLCISTQCQVYKPPKIKNKKIQKAIEATSNLILTYRNQPINAFYHGSNGGISATAGESWQIQDYSYFNSIIDASKSLNKIFKIPITNESDLNNFLDFDKVYENTKVIRLEQNYRSSQNILSVASDLISNNQNRVGKTLITTMEEGDPVQLNCFKNGKDEAIGISDEIEKKIKKKFSYNNIAILVRAIFQTREFEERFLKIGMPYRILGGTKFYERAEIKDCVAYLRLIHQEKDDLAFERIVNNPKRSIGDSTLKNIHEFAKENNLNLERASIKMLEQNLIKPKAKIGLSLFVNALMKWRNDLIVKKSSHIKLLQIVLDESGYSAMLKNKKDLDNENRLENIKELLSAMKEFDNLESFLEHVSLATSVDQEWDGEKINMMTMHAAKGLEFDVVFLPGWEEGLFPHQKSIEEKGQNGLEEERRLAYVGITRAKKKAIISFSMNRFYQGDWIDSMASRFVDELPEKNLEKNSFFDEKINNDDDFDFNQDFEIEEGTRSPGWIRYQKRIK